MIFYVRGDATNPGRPGVIAHVVNDCNAWGAGFVLAVSRRWKEPEAAYRAWARGDDRLVPFVLGNVQFVHTAEGMWIANMLAQTGIGRGNGIPLRYDALGQCLVKVAAHAKEMGMPVFMPRIGTGLAGGAWSLVEPLIEQAFAGMSRVTVFDLP